jgi:hypothetical protein
MMRAGRARTWTAAALSGLLAAAPVLRAAPPSWVASFPRDPDAYVGIGRADKRLNPLRYREAAQEAALAQIGREISVELRSESRSARSEGADGARETFDETVTAASSARLAGYERAGTYETEGEFWVLYTLDKEVFRGQQERRATGFLAWMSREAEAADAALAGRRYQEAAERLAAVSARYRSDLAGDAWLQARFPEPEARVAGMAARIRAALRGLSLVSPADPWVLDWRASPPVPVELVLADHSTGEQSAGPLTLWIAETRGPGAACRAETDGRGRLDLGEAALRCGLGPGIWTMSWRGPEGRKPGLTRRVSFRRCDLHVTLRAEGRSEGNHPEAGAAKRPLVLLREELALLEDARYRIVMGPQGSSGAPSADARFLDVQILESSADTLEGMHFTALRGRVRFPDDGGAAEIAGKAGHTDPVRSYRKAARDFARQVADSLRARFPR